MSFSNIFFIRMGVLVMGASEVSGLAFNFYWGAPLFWSGISFNRCCEESLMRLFCLERQGKKAFCIYYTQFGEMA